ncbi:MAG: hypothetical protein AAB209_03530 [Bacteroidota bacterium]|mgnify:CR=1 FL=1
MSLEEIELAIKSLDKSAQQQLLTDLPKLLEIDFESLGWLKVAEPSFEFWDNPKDAVYDNL